jgi:hypothetical protein
MLFNKCVARQRFVMLSSRAYKNITNSPQDGEDKSDPHCVLQDVDNNCEKIDTSFSWDTDLRAG